MKSSFPHLQAPHLPSLDGIRAVAVLIVVAFHYYDSPVLPKGGTGVLLFFVLSGFLITWLLLQEMAATGTVSIRDFYERRARRILPALYVAIPFSIAVWVLAGNQFRWAELWSCLGFVSNYYYIFTDMRAPNALPVTWSLAIEEQFYLLWPILFFAFRRRMGRLIRILSGLERRIVLSRHLSSTARTFISTMVSILATTIS
jgi:peptidoglycan/LPS O-acetylase OafA/YrhL